MPNENVALTVNGRRHALDLDPRVTLLDALREHLGLRLVSLAAITVIVSRADETQASIFHTRIA
jgi:aerobic-type carbon monoxide dehydrogenase small subunit (CoxS/CutS family)